MLKISDDYLQSIKEVQTLVCPPPALNFTQPAIGVADVSNYTNVPNFNAPNWIEGGNVTAQSIKLVLLNNAVNWTYCPLDKPFVMKNTSTCAACPK